MLLLLTLLCDSASSSAAGNNPLSPDKSTIRFGRIPVGASRSQIVTIQNVGQKVIRIRKITSTCGCARASLAVSELRAGVQVELLVVGKPTKAGRQTGTVFLHTDDPTHPQAAIEVEVQAFTPLKARPEYIQFGDVPLGGEHRQSLSLSLPGENDAVVTGLVYNKDLLDVTASPPTAKERDAIAQLQVALRATAPAGLIREGIEIKIRGADVDACVVAVYGYVRGDLSVSPGSLLFMSVVPDSVVTRRLAVRSHTGRVFRVLSVATDMAAVSVDFEQSEQEGPSITAQLDSGKLSQSTAGTLTIATDDQLQPKLEVPIRVYFRR